MKITSWNLDRKSKTDRVCLDENTGHRNETQAAVGAPSTEKNFEWNEEKSRRTTTRTADEKTHAMRIDRRAKPAQA
jgi:hypothetical protein